MVEYIQQMRPFFGEAERLAIANYDFENGFLTEFKHTKEFERQLANKLQVQFCSVVNSGTTALTVAALACGVEAKHEVIVPNFTMIATPNSVRLLGAKPIFCDVEKQTLCLDRDHVISKISPMTKAVILVNANGRYPSYDVEEFRVYLNSRNIYLIEDAAQSLGSKYPDGTSIGSKSNIATLSFSTPKIISTGQGGALFTNDADLNCSIKKIKDFGRLGGGNDIHDVFGINSKFTDLQAIVGLTQLAQLDERVKIRKKQHAIYESGLKGMQNVEVVKNNLSYTCPWFSEILAEYRDELMLYLHENGIGSRKMYPPINTQAIYLSNQQFPISKNVGDYGLWLPSHIGIDGETIAKIMEQIDTFYNLRHRTG